LEKLTELKSEVPWNLTSEKKAFFMNFVPEK
jgi:hypothetical protein